MALFSSQPSSPGQTMTKKAKKKRKEGDNDGSQQQANGRARQVNFHVRKLIKAAAKCDETKVLWRMPRETTGPRPGHRR